MASLGRGEASHSQDQVESTPRKRDLPKHTDPPTSGARARVVLVAGAGEVGAALESALARRGYPPVRVGSVGEALAELALREARLILYALPLPDATGRDAIARVRAVADGVPFIVVGVDDDVTDAGEAFDLGAFEHLTEPLGDASDFLATVGAALGSRRGDRHLQYLREKEAPGTGWQSLVGASPAIQRALSILRQVATRGGAPTILITGETGSGKGFAAKCVHYNGTRRNRPFVEVNCAALPPTLMESELFGHERGSFTDAKTSRPGLFETANSGTLFLDEIGAMPLDLQAKLLKAIEEKKLRRIGGRSELVVDVQIIAATHEDLRRRVKDGSFRGDLFHRLNVVAVQMPTLRDRGDDIGLLADAFLQQLCREYGMPPRTLAPDAMRWLRAYAWPGNVRELRNSIERIVLLENDPVVRAHHFGQATDGAVRVVSNDPTDEGQPVRVSLPPSGVPLATLEREVLREALARCDGNVSRAARFLSISRQTLMYRMRKHQLG